MKKMLVGLTLAAAVAVPTAAPSAAGAQPASASSNSAIARAAKAPSVRCVQLDVAERRLKRKGYRVRLRGGGMFGIVVKSAWVVVNQRQSGKTVTLTAGRSC